MNLEAILASVSSIAVWGSLAASALLSAFMFVQAWQDSERRWRYLLVAILMAVVALTDALHVELGARVYEKLRAFEWSCYGAAVLALFGTPPMAALGLAATVAFAGLLTWITVDPTYATTTVLTLSFLLAAYAHGRQYRRRAGFGSCILTGLSLCQAFACILYIPVVSLQQPLAIGLGYFHYVTISSLAVVFGWVHVPREIQGKIPTEVNFRRGILFIGALLVCELCILPSFLLLLRPLPIFLFASAAQVLVVILLFFIHRHDLIIYTDNVTQLLEQRTKSLREAQSELAQKNETQAMLLTRQAEILQQKSEVIKRQRRLELAAQTAGQAAHDIQNLISPIVAQLEELTSPLQTQELEGARIKAVERRIRRQLDALLDLNSQMLALSRRGRLEMSPLNLHELAQDLYHRFPEASGRLKIESDESLWIEGSWSQLSRAFVNVLSNALEASLDRAQVVLKIDDYQNETNRRCHLGFLAPGRFARVQIIDSGEGIPPHLLDQIFEPFFSSKRDTTRSGSGLGLSIVSSVVEDHHGTLDVVSAPGQTIFSIYLPVAKTPGGVLDLAGLCGNETVAVIDDDKSILLQYETLLVPQGYSVLLAASGEEAIELFHTQLPDLVLLDQSMNGMTGLQTFFALVHLHPGLRVILHSGFVSPQDLKQFQDYGIDGVLQKPASKGETLRIVREILDRPRSATRAA